MGRLTKSYRYGRTESRQNDVRLYSDDFTLESEEVFGFYHGLWCRQSLFWTVTFLFQRLILVKFVVIVNDRVDQSSDLHSSRPQPRRQFVKIVSRSEEGRKESRQESNDRYLGSYRRSTDGVFRISFPDPFYPKKNVPRDCSFPLEKVYEGSLRGIQIKGESESYQ